MLSTCHSATLKGKAMKPTALPSPLFHLALAICLALAATATPAVAVAETIAIPLASQGQGQQLPAMPRRGIEKAQVLKEFGEPISRSPAIGDPPITRWEYGDYYVFFEYEHVIHSVVKHRPQSP